MEAMKSGLSEEQSLLMRTIRDFARTEVAPRAAEMDEHPEKNDILQIFARMADFGMHAAMAPEEQGGQGMNLHSFLLSLVELARESAAVAALGLSHNLALKTLALCGSELPASLTGHVEILCLGLPARLDKGGSGGVVSGGCDFSPGLLLASRAVLVSPEGEVVSVALGDNGVTVAYEHTHGLRAARPGALALDEAGILQQGRLEDEAHDYLKAALCLGSVAMATGIAAKGAEVSRAYARERYQGGSIIYEHQQMRLMLGGMRAVEEVGLALLQWACGEGGDRPSLSVALAAKALVCEKARDAASDAVQLHGGYGYMRDHGMERLMRDASYCCAWPLSGREALLQLEEGDGIRR